MAVLRFDAWGQDLLSPSKIYESRGSRGEVRGFEERTSGQLGEGERGEALGAGGGGEVGSFAGGDDLQGRDAHKAVRVGECGSGRCREHRWDRTRAACGAWLFERVDGLVEVDARAGYGMACSVRDAENDWGEGCGCGDDLVGPADNSDAESGWVDGDSGEGGAERGEAGVCASIPGAGL